jgi:predicted ArsR family transcriptional regulator
MVDATDGSPKEGPPRGMERWKEQTKGIERVIDVALAVEQPETAGTIADEALVSEQAAREHLDLLAELGIIKATTARGVTKYQPDVAYLRFKEVSKYAEQYDRDTLMDRVDSIQRKLEETEAEYEVESPDGLRALAAEEGTDTETIREYKKAASEWDSLLHQLDILQEALERYDEFDRAVAEA